MIFFLFCYIRMRRNACIMLMKELTIFNSLYLGLFISVLHVFCRHLNIILIHFYWLLLLESVLRFPPRLSGIFWTPVNWILSQFNWLVATWCGIWVWGMSEEITNSFISFPFFFTCTLLLGSSFAGIFWVRSFPTF